jgi:hypothetical protein
MVRSIIVSFLVVFLSASCNIHNEMKFKRLINEAKTDISNEQFDRGLKSINEAIKIEPDTMIVYSIRGELYYLTHKYDLAIKDFKTALSYQSSSQSYFYIGLNFFNLDQDDSAIYYYNRAIQTMGTGEIYIEVNPAGPLGGRYTDDVPMEAIRYYRGVSSYLLGRYKDAHLDFRFSVSKNFNVGDSYLYMGIMEIDLENDSLGCKYLKLAVENRGTNAEKYLLEYCKN